MIPRSAITASSRSHALSVTTRTGILGPYSDGMRRRARRAVRQWLPHHKRRNSAAPTDSTMPTPDATVEVIVICVRPSSSRPSGERTTTRERERSGCARLHRDCLGRGALRRQHEALDPLTTEVVALGELELVARELECHVHVEGVVIHERERDGPRAQETRYVRSPEDADVRRRRGDAGDDGGKVGAACGGPQVARLRHEHQPVEHLEIGVR